MYFAERRFILAESRRAAAELVFKDPGDQEAAGIIQAIPEQHLVPEEAQDSE